MDTKELARLETSPAAEKYQTILCSHVFGLYYNISDSWKKVMFIFSLLAVSGQQSVVGYELRVVTGRSLLREESSVECLISE